MEDSDRMRQVLVPVKHEAATVIAEMRQNKKWAAAPSSLSVVRSV